MLVNILKYYFSFLIIFTTFIYLAYTPHGFPSSCFIPYGGWCKYLPSKARAASITVSSGLQLLLFIKIQ